MSEKAQLEAAIRGLDFSSPEQRLEGARLRVRMGSQLSADGQYAQAICNFRRGIATLKKSTGNDRYVGHAWTGIAIAEWSLDGRGPAQALRSAKVAVDLLVNSPDDNVAKQIISSEDVLALCYFETGRHELARRHYASVLRRAQDAGADDAYSHVKRRMALACLELNDCALAERLLVETKPVEDAGAELRIAWLNGWALLCERMWRLDEVTRSYEEALEIFETAGAPPWKMSAILTNGAQWFIDQGHEQLLQRARSLIEQCPVVNQPLSVRLGRHRLAAALAIRNGDRQAAHLHWQEIIELTRATAASDPTKLRNVILESAQQTASGSRPGAAAALLRSALGQREFEDAVGIVAGQAGLAALLADVLTSNGQIAEARNLLRERLAEQMAQSDAVGSYRFLSAMANAARDTGSRPAAILFAKMACELLGQAANAMDHIRSDQRAFVDRHVVPVQQLIDDLIKDSRFLEADQAQKVISLETMTQLLRGTRIATLAVDRISYQAAEQRLRDEFGALSGQLQRLRSKAIDPTISARRRSDSRQEFFDAAKTARRWYEAAIASDWAVAVSAEPSSHEYREPKEGQALLRMSAGYSSLALTFIDSAGAQTLTLDISVDNLLKEVFQFWRQLSRGEEPHLPLAQQLYHRLIAPFSPNFDEIEVLKVVVPGALSLLPWAALHDGRRYLCEKAAVCSLPTHELAELPIERSEPVGAFGFARSVGAEDLPPLMFAKRELKSLERRLGAETFADGSFTRDQLAATLLANPSLVHIASHFIAAPGSLFRSRLLVGDGEITVGELLDAGFQWQNLRLLVLSACSTSIYDAGDSAMQDLSVLFQSRGVHSVISTLWPVSDMATAQLMDIFYANYTTGTGPAQALAIAQREMIARNAGSAYEAGGARGLKGQTVAPDFAHPLNWAGLKLQTR